MNQTEFRYTVEMVDSKTKSIAYHECNAYSAEQAIAKIKDALRLMVGPTKLKSMSVSQVFRRDL